MRVLVPVLPVLAFAAMASAASAQTADGEALYRQRCIGCHEGAVPGAPTRVQLKRRPQARIVQALSSGVMKPQASGLNTPQIHALAAHLGAPAKGRARSELDGSVFRSSR